VLGLAPPLDDTPRGVSRAAAHRPHPRVSPRGGGPARPGGIGAFSCADFFGAWPRAGQSVARRAGQPGHRPRP
jgi:hypothetical protein